MAYQFIHYEKYKLADLEGIIGELIREAKYCPHVANPKDCIQIYGSIDQFKAKLEKEVPEYRREVLKGNRYGTKLVSEKLSDKNNVFLCGIASFPIKNADMKPSDAPEFERWLDRTMKFLKTKYGDQLQCVVGHLDESHPHLHFYVIPKDYDMSNACAYDKAIKDFNTSKVKGSGPDTGKKLAGVEALRRYQDDYYEQVGFYCGQSRLGPKKRRLSRQEWVEEQSANQLAANCVNKTLEQSRKATKATTLQKKQLAGLMSGLVITTIQTGRRSSHDQTGSRSQEASQEIAALKATNALLNNKVQEQEMLIGMVTGLGTATPTAKTPSKDPENRPTPADLNPGAFSL